MITPRELADGMKRRLGPTGEHWHKGSMYDHTGTKMCVIGALDAAARLFEHRDGQEDYFQREDMVRNFRNAMEEKARELFPDRGVGGVYSPGAASVNDHHDTVFEDVIVIIDKTTLELEEKA